MAESNVSDRLYLTAYLYSEYVLRNIEKNNPDLLEWLKYIKSNVCDIIDDIYNNIYTEICNYISINDTYIPEDIFDIISNEFSIDILMDAILENECNINSDKYDCDLFSGAILKRLSSRNEFINNDLFVKCVNIINEYLMDELICPQFQELVRLSLKEGIYMTHLDSFRNEQYYLTIPDPLPKEFYLRHIFFKSEKSFWKNDKHIYYNIPEYSIYNRKNLIKEWKEQLRSRTLHKDKDRENRVKFSTLREDLKAYLMQQELERELAIYFPIFDDNFDLDTYLSQSQSIIIASRLDNLEPIIDNYKKYSDFIERFFTKDIYRLIEDEVKGKILGILIWDEMRYSNSISHAISSISEKYKTRLFSPKSCYEPICKKNCVSSSDCMSIARRLYKVADQSIKNKKIITSKELK